MINIQVGLSEPEPDDEAETDPDPTKVAGLLARGRQRLKSSYPEAELWQIELVRGGARYDLVDAAGRKMSAVPAVGDRAHQLQVEEIVVVAYRNRNPALPEIKTAIGKAKWDFSALLAFGRWGQAWANPFRDAFGEAASSGADFVGQYPGSGLINFTGGPSGNGPARCLVYLPGGRLGIAQWIEDSGELSKVRFLVVTPAADNSWAVEAFHDFDLTALRDRKGPQGYNNDCYGFYDQSTQFITLFTRMFRALPTEAPDTTFATVLTISVANPLALNEANIGEIQVGALASDRLTAREMNVAGQHMCRGAFSEILSKSAGPVWDRKAHVFTYSQSASGRWALVAAVDWLDLAMDRVFTPRYQEPDNRPAWLPSDVQGNGAMPGFELSNNRPQFGPPFAQVGGNRAFYGLAAARGAIGLSDLELVGAFRTHYAFGQNYFGAKVVEIEVDARTGAVNFNVVYEETTFTQGQATKLSNSIESAAADYPPLYEPSSFSENRIASCLPIAGPTPYTYTERKIYLGAIFEQYQNPYNTDIIFFGLGADRKIGCGQPWVFPNYVASRSGKRYGAFTRWLPYWTTGDLSLRRVAAGDVRSQFYLPHPEADSGYFSNNFSTIGFVQTGTACGVVTDRLYVGAYIPALVFMEATVIFGMPGSSQMILPQQFHEFSSGDPFCPIREEFFQAIPCEELGVVFWLHNWRDSRLTALGVPMVTVTDLAVSQVLYTIPASELFPLDKFESDQIHTVEGGDTEVWARAGEYVHYCNNIDGRGPLAKLVKITGSVDKFRLILAGEYYQRVTPGDWGYSPITESQSFFESDSIDGVTFVLGNGPASISRVYVDDYSNEVSFTFTAPSTVVLAEPLGSGYLVVDYTYTIETAHPPGEGSTWTKSWVIDVTASGFTLEKVVEEVATWTYPNIVAPYAPFSIDDLRTAVVGPDRFIQGLNQVPI